jgi:chemotaxis signal transduction protein
VLILLLQIGQSRYGLDSEAVVQVLPRLQMQTMAGSLPAVAGAFLRAGSIVPVLDAGVALEGRPASGGLRNRIVLMRRPDPQPGPPSGPQPPLLFGVLVEAVVEVKRFALAAATALQASASCHHALIARVLVDDHDMIPLLAWERLSAEVPARNPNGAGKVAVLR